LLKGPWAKKGGESRQYPDIQKIGRKEVRKKCAVFSK